LPTANGGGENPLAVSSHDILTQATREGASFFEEKNRLPPYVRRQIAAAAAARVTQTRRRTHAAAAAAAAAAAERRKPETARGQLAPWTNAATARKVPLEALDLAGQIAKE